GLKELNGVIPEPGAPASSAAAAGGRSQRVVAAIELSAQLHYRLENNKECIQLYDTLFQQYKAGSLELRTNVLAAYVAAGLSQELEELMAAMKVTAKDSFEACGLAECGRLSEAETELRRALKLGGGGGGAGAADCAAGVRAGPPGAQRGGHGAVLRSTKEEAVDGLSRAVATNNLFADSGRIDALPAHKKSVAGAAKKLEGLMEDASKPGSTALQPVMESRLSSDQKRLLTLNRALTYLLSGRLAPAKELAEAVARQEQAAAAAQEQQPPPAWAGPQLLPLLQAALLAKEGKVGGPQGSEATGQ
ncbi:SRP72 domain-containing protein, partial [Haematococcus lacustris]